MKTHARKLFSVMLSLIMTLMCMTTASTYADYQVIPEQTPKSVSKMMFYLNTSQASAGQDIQVDLLASNPVALKSLEHVILSIPDGFEFTGISDYSPMFNGSVTYEKTGNSLNFSITGDGSLNEGSSVVSINFHVSENCSAGTYDFKWITTAMSCTTPTGNRYSPTFIMGRITVGGSAGTTQTIVPTTTTTKTTTTTTTTTSATTTDTQTTTE
ncbi:MAG: hypothetical protein K2F73_00700, partial [Ruminococcus sp.]|nr:hypothetical protein [Ruminococcus sp.]